MLKSIITSVVIALITGGLVVGIIGTMTPQEQKDMIMSEFNFQIEEVSRTTTSTEFYYTSVRRSTSTNEAIVRRELAIITIDNVGYNMCIDGVWGTSTKTFCIELQKEQLRLNEKWFLEGELGRIRMLKYK